LRMNRHTERSPALSNLRAVLHYSLGSALASLLRLS